MVDMDKKSRFLELIEQNQDIVHKICALYAWNADDRKDLGQEIVCQLWKSYPSFRSDSAFTTWMYRVALNTAVCQSMSESMSAEYVREYVRVNPYEISFCFY